MLLNCKNRTSCFVRKMLGIPICVSGCYAVLFFLCSIENQSKASFKVVFNLHLMSI